MSDSPALEPRLLAALTRILEGLPNAGPTLSGLLDFCARELESLFPRLHVSFAATPDHSGDAPPHLTLHTTPNDSLVDLQPDTVFMPLSADVLKELRQHQPVLTPLSPNSPDALAVLAAAGFESLLLVPLLTENQLLGTWNLAARDRDTFGPAETDLFRHLGDALALAVGRAHLQARLDSQQQQLIETEKLAAVGRLVAGVAHELGGPLQAVISLAELLVRNPDGHDRTEASHRILRSALRCRGMVQDLLTYARKQPHRLVSTSVSDALMDALELDRFSDVGEVQISLEETSHAAPVLADPQRLTQVFLNLITNARHATTQDGKPGLVRVSMEEVPAERARIHLPADGRALRIAVEDDGPGVPVQDRERIFEPFVTTKPPGVGTGLGLSVSRSLIMDMGGALWLDQDYSGGARFVVELPRSDEAPVASARIPGVESAEAADPIPTAGKRILLIDDDREVLETYEVILGLEDHKVRSCDRGKKALAILESETFDAILCDIRLPDITGPEFFAELQQRHPELSSRVVFATGDVVNDTTRGFLASIPNPALIKPFQLEDLLRAVTQVTQLPSE